MPLGEDYDMPDEKKVLRDKGEGSSLQGKFIKITSGGTKETTNIVTSDGLDLCMYGIEIAHWEINPTGVMATIIFHDAMIDSTIPLENLFIGDMASTNIPSELPQAPVEATVDEVITHSSSIDKISTIEEHGING